MVPGRHFFTMIKRYILLILVTPLACSSCVSIRRGAIISTGKTIYHANWSEEEHGDEIVVKTLNVTDTASYHVIRLVTAEKPHIHDYHDLTVFVLKGRARMNLGDRTEIVKAGDVIEIPRGVVHWAENIGRQASEVYAVFSPPFDGVDRRFVAE